MVDLNKGATVELVKALSDDIRTMSNGVKGDSAGAVTRNAEKTTSENESRLFSLDGIIKAEWEVGGVDVNAENSHLELLGSNYNERIRIKNGKVFKIRKGTFIYLSSYINFSLRVLKSSDNDAYTKITVDGVTLHSFLADEDYYCTFSIVSKNQTVQLGTTAAELFTLEYDKSMSNKFANLTRAVTEQNKRLFAIDGVLNVEWEIGGHGVNNDGSLVHPAPGIVSAFPKIRSKYGNTYFVKKATDISLSSYTDFRLLIYVSNDGITFDTTAVSLYAGGPTYYRPANDVYCVFVIVTTNNENQTNTAASALFEAMYNSELNQVNTRLSAILQTSQIIDTHLDSFHTDYDRLIGDELIAETTAGKTLAYKFNIVAGHSYRFINLGTDINTMMLYAGNTPTVNTSTLLERSIGARYIREFSADADYKYIYVYTATANSRFSIRDLDALSFEREDIPDYYVSHLEQKIREINDSTDACGLTGDSFVFMTDYHSQSNAQNSNRLIKKILDNTGCRFFMFGGDVQDTEDSRNGGINQLRLFKEHFRDVTKKMYCLLGNHEFNPYTLDAQTAPQYLVSHSKAYEMMLKDKESTYGGISEYGNYWFDNSAQKIRYICTTCDYASDMPADSIKWVLNALKDVPDDYGIIILSHLTFDISPSDNTKAYLRKGIYSIAQALDFYNNRGTFTYDDTAFDFSQCGGKVLCVMGGHTHFDFDSAQESSILQPDWIPSPLPDTMVIATTTDAYKRQNKTFRPMARELHTVAEHAFDVVHVNTQSATIKMFRIGAGHNRIYHLDNMTSVGTLSTELTGTITWTSSDTSVATVSGGTVTVIGSGRARIVATDESGNTETWTVKE